MKPTALVRTALGLEPLGAPYSGNGTWCVLCGYRIALGDLVSHFRAGTNFMDDAELGYRGEYGEGGFVCGDCNRIISPKSVMLQLQNSVVTERGLLSFAKTSHRKHFLLHPPKPPFLVLVAETILGHLAWRCPLTTSPDILFVRFTYRTLRIRMPKVREAHTVLARALQNVNEGRKTPMRRPLLNNDRNIAELDFALLNPNVIPALKKEELSLINGLSIGEMWALTILQDPNAPEEPTIKTNSVV